MKHHAHRIAAFLRRFNKATDDYIRAASKSAAAFHHLDAKRLEKAIRQRLKVEAL